MVTGSLGVPYARPTSIPQGCPWSMAVIALVLRAWILVMRQIPTRPRLLADDLQVWAESWAGR
eukprot:9165927-Alexandrium_andersonii.AAC.1